MGLNKGSESWPSQSRHKSKITDMMTSLQGRGKDRQFLSATDQAVASSMCPAFFFSTKCISSPSEVCSFRVLFLSQYVK